MPKSNFNQFLDECEHFKTFESKTVSKISFETNLGLESENESQNKSQPIVSNYNTSLSSSSSEKHSNARSSNIFLSNNANSKGQNRFSTNRSNNNNNNNAAHNINDNEHVKRENNIFKKMDTSQTFGASPPPSTSSHVVEINNETFPSLGSTSVSNSTTNNTVPKKFKNFKDAICTSVAEPVLSPSKQKQLKAIPVKSQSSFTGVPPPLAVKKDSEMYAKKILAKTKNFAMDYDNYDDDDDDDGDYHVQDISNNNESLYKNNYKQTFIKRWCNHNDDSDD